VLGPHAISYAVAVGAVDPYVLAEDAFVPLLVTTGTGAGEHASAEPALTIDGAEVSSVRRGDGGRLEVRVFNPTPGPVTVGLGGRRGWRVDLRGRPQDAADGTFELGPWAIATVAFTD
jgi:hypothetical protein